MVEFFQMRRRTNILRLGKLARWSGLLIAVMGLLACGGSSSAPNGDNSEAEFGELALSITDAEGDFLRYEVVLKSIVLERVDGTQVRTVPRSSVIDFVEYVDLAELFYVGQVPAGRYRKVYVTLDFSAAEVVVQDELGEANTALVQDHEGNKVDELQVQLRLGPRHLLHVRPGVPAALSMDFDLQSSNEILSTDPAVVQVDPVWLADAALDHEKEHRVRGVLKSVDLTQQSFTLRVRPPRYRGNDWGRFKVAVDENTKLEISAQHYVGAEGLVALAALSEDSPMVVLGKIQQGDSPLFLAQQIVAGTSVAWHGADFLQGVVISRSENMLAVQGWYRHWQSERRSSLQKYVVEFSENTTVSQLLSPDLDWTANDISVGQRILVLGEPGDKILDASAGHIRLQTSQIQGSVLSVTPLTLDLQLINGRRPGNFDFSGTGTSPEHDADPQLYQVNSQTLDLGDLDIGEPIQLRGFVSPFASAPEDFIAQTSIERNRQGRGVNLFIAWREGTDNPFVSVGANGWVINSSEGNYKVNRGIGQISLDFFANSASLIAADNALFVIKQHSGEAVTFRDFSEFDRNVHEQLAAGKLVKNISAHGYVQPGGSEMGVRRLLIKLK